MIVAEEVRKAIHSARRNPETRAVERARVMLREMFGGNVKLRDAGSHLVAEFEAGVVP